MLLAGRSHTDTKNGRNPQKSVDLPPASVDTNNRVLNNDEELRRKKAEFERQKSTYKLINRTFTEVAKALMESKGWQRKEFKENTLLDDTTYHNICTDVVKGWDKRTVMAFCIGICADHETAVSLLAMAGHALGESDEDRAYEFLLTAYHGRSIGDCNMFLEDNFVKPLGNKLQSTKAKRR